MNPFTILSNPTTTTTTIPLNTTNTFLPNVPRSYHENKNQIKHINNSNNMLNNTKTKPNSKWKCDRSRIPIETPKYNRIHYKRSSPPHTTSLTQYNGILKWFNPDTKYGFIIYKNQELFVHETAFINISSQKIINYINQSVTFNIDIYIDKKTQKKKQKAINVNITNTNTNTNNTHAQNTQPNNNAQHNGKYKGILLWFNEDKKFGFIRCDIDNNNNDLFVYESELKFNKTSLYKGMRLQFDIEIYFDHYGHSKKKAINVDIAMDAKSQSSDSLSGEAWKPNINKQITNNYEINSSYSLRHNRLHYTFSNRILNNKINNKYCGQLLWFDINKKHGFIECDDINIIDDVFVYETDFIFPKYLIEKDMRLLFDIKIYLDAKGNEKKKAINVIIDHEYKYPQIYHKHEINNKPSKFEQKGNNNTFGNEIIVNKTQNVIANVNVIQISNHILSVQVKQGNDDKIEIEEKTLNAEAVPFIPQSFITKPKQIILEPIIESEHEEEIIVINKKKKKKKIFKKKKKNKNKFEKLFDINDYKIISKELMNIFNNENNNKNYNIIDIYNRLFALSKSYRNKLFLDVNLEFLSLLEGNKSILNVMYYINKYKHQLIDIYFNKLLNINLDINIIKNEFKDYGLKCVYPSKNNNNIIKDLINKNSNINEFIKYKCYDFINYFGMYEILNYILPKYVFNNNNYNNLKEIFKFMELMVIDDDIDDFDNNDKLLFLSIIVTIFHKYNMLNGGENSKNGEIFCNFITELLNKNILSIDVIDKWRLDEYDFITLGKKNALILLTDLIHELQNKEIKDNIIQEFLLNVTDDQYEIEMYYLKYLNEAYIGTNDLLQINTNRHVSNRCPWKYS